jgi:cardiolipin synthase
VLENSGAVLAALLQILLSAIASGHVLLNKREVHAAIGWVALIWFVPVAGAVLYFLLGINRVRRRAAGLRARYVASTGARRDSGQSQRAIQKPRRGQLATITRVLDAVAGQPLTEGNRIEPLAGGSAAYAAMLDAIGAARRSVGLSSYIFDLDSAGRRFVAALAAAEARGVAVRVLIDGIGVHYSHPPITTELKRHGVPAATFLPGLLPFFLQYANLRNHRKILVVDGEVAFTGGMNLRAGHLDEAPIPTAIRDVHFRLHGPVVDQLLATFVEDWRYATGEDLNGDAWRAFVPADAAGAVLARVITSGPDEDFERIRLAILAAIAAARCRLRIVTPYFLPGAALMEQLELAALRGLRVEIVMPKENNLKLVEWASLARIGTLLDRGCRIWLSPPPFDHAKLMTVDGEFSLIGSANWDPRSFSLNFEVNVECYDEAFTAKLDELIDRRIGVAEPLTHAEINNRSLARKMRDGAAWLLSPYL